MLARRGGLELIEVVVVGDETYRVVAVQDVDGLEEARALRLRHEK